MMKIFDILIIQSLVSFAGIFYSLIFTLNINLIVFFVTEMILTSMLILRVENYKKAQFKKGLA